MESNEDYFKATDPLLTARGFKGIFLFSVLHAGASLIIGICLPILTNNHITRSKESNKTSIINTKKLLENELLNQIAHRNEKLV